METRKYDINIATKFLSHNGKCQNFVCIGSDSVQKEFDG